jgi:hypothetical protein
MACRGGRTFRRLQTVPGSSPSVSATLFCRPILPQSAEVGNAATV